MNYNEKKARLLELYDILVSSGKVSTKKELAAAIKMSYSNVCNAFGNDEKALTESLLSKVAALVYQSDLPTSDARLARLNELYEELVSKKIVSTKKEFADYLGITYSNLVQAMNGNERFLTTNFVNNVEQMVYLKEQENQVRAYQVPLLPIEARGGSLVEYSEGVQSYQCEMVASPIKGATFAIQVTGESMSPDYPNGSHVLIQKVSADVFISWGCVYVLDTLNGIVIKEVYPTDDDEVIECRSINPKYAPFKVRKEYILGWYRVLMCMSLK